MHGRPPRMSGCRAIRLPISVTVAIDSSIPPCWWTPRSAGSPRTTAGLLRRIYPRLIARPPASEQSEFETRPDWGAKPSPLVSMHTLANTPLAAPRPSSRRPSRFTHPILTHISLSFSSRVPPESPQCVADAPPQTGPRTAPLPANRRVAARPGSRFAQAPQPLRRLKASKTPVHRIVLGVYLD
jgi:hypothetical protein